MADPAVFDRPELGALWTELRRRFEAAGDGEVRTSPGSTRRSAADAPLHGVTGDELSTTVLVARYRGFRSSLCTAVS